jgi:hypothetical protein
VCITTWSISDICYQMGEFCNLWTYSLVDSAGSLSVSGTDGWEEH